MRTIHPDHVLAAMASLSRRPRIRPDLPPAAGALLPFALPVPQLKAVPVRAAA